MKIVNCNNDIYKKQIVDLYVEVFSTGISEQYIDLAKLELYVEKLVENQFSYITVNDDNVIAAILSCELKYDECLPTTIRQNYTIENSLYIAELIVKNEFQGQGIGSELIDKVLSTIQKSTYTDVFIRVWKENKGAIKLYEKKGFLEVATVEQIKLKPDGKENFTMEKIYLHKKNNLKHA